MQGQTVRIAHIRDERGFTYRSELREADGAFRWYGIEPNGGETWDGWEFQNVAAAELTLALEILDTAPDLSVQFEEV